MFNNPLETFSSSMKIYYTISHGLLNLLQFCQTIIDAFVDFC